MKTEEREEPPPGDIESCAGTTSTKSPGAYKSKQLYAADPKLRLAPAQEPGAVAAALDIDAGNQQTESSTSTQEVVPGAVRYSASLQVQSMRDSYQTLQSQKGDSSGALQNQIPIAGEVAETELTSMTKEDVANHIREVLSSAPVAKVVDEEKDPSPPPSETKESKPYWIIAGFFLVILVVVAIIVSLTLNNEDAISPSPTEVEATPPPTEVEVSPPLSAAVGGLSTVEEIKMRGFLKCSLYATYVGFSRVEESVGIASGFNWDLCRAVAAVVLGDPNAVEPFVATAKTRFTSLKEGKVDMVAMTTTHNMGRDVWEDNALVGASYTVPYVYTGMAFAGKPEFVECAEKLDFFTGNCRDLKICVRESTSYDGRLQQIFPGPEKVHADSHIENFLKLEQDKCNVVVDSSAALPESIARSFGYTGEYVLGDKRFSKEPFCLNTREDDPEWTSLVGLIMKALYTADMYDIYKSNAADPLDIYEGMDESLKSIIVDSVSAVGNMNELYERHLHDVVPRTGKNVLNDGSSGLIYSFPFGKYEIVGELKQGGIIESILERGYVRCGVTRRPGFANFDGTTWTGIDIEFCRAVAAALFSSGDASRSIEYVEISIPSERLSKLSEGKVDLLAGERVTILKGWHDCTFSPPYFYENDDSNDSYALATYQDDPQFSDMVFWTVMATFYAEENGITNSSSTDMPLVNLFGERFKPMFLDTVLEVGNYGEIYDKTLQALIPRVGRNTLNDESGPQQFAFPFF